MAKDYQATLHFLFSSLPMYQNVGKTAFKKSLNNIQQLCKILNHPEKNFKTIHVAGTNGKGSTASMIAAGLQKDHLKIGLYTSPHLLDYSERIKINGEVISKKHVIDFVDKYKVHFQTLQPSFFEWSVALAFHYFSTQQVDFAVIEAGLGGRLDSTNIIHPLLSVITNISYDHCDMLGDTLEKIASEKAGIIKPNTPVLIGQKQTATTPIFKTHAKRVNSPLFFARDLADPLVINNLLEKQLAPSYEENNLITGYAALKLLANSYAITFDEKTLERLKNYKKLTGFRGRWETLAVEPKIVLDCAHNQEGWKALNKTLEKVPFKDLHLVIGVVNDKDIDALANYLPKQANYYLCQPQVQRGLATTVLKTNLEKYSLTINGEYKLPKNALAAAKKKANKKDLIIITGSIFLITNFIK